MALASILPARRRKGDLARRSDILKAGEDWGGLTSLQREMNRMFENFFSDFSPLSFTGMEERLGRFSPRVDVAETDKEIKVTAELPGMDEKDIEVKLEEGYLLLSGEKKEEKQEEAEGYYHQEMSYGSFQRRIPIDAKIEVDKVKAKFNNGILKVTMPKVPGSESKKAKKIEIKG